MDVEKAVIESLEKQFADVLAPLKENLAPKKFGFKYVQKLTKRTPNPYAVPSEVCIVVYFDIWGIFNFSLISILYIFLEYTTLTFLYSSIIKHSHCPMKVAAFS